MPRCGAPALLALAAPAAAWPSAPNSYPHYPGRSLSVLDGEWDFEFSADYDVAKQTDISAFTFPSKQTVPGAWDARWGTGLQYQRGTGAYRARASVAAGRPALLHFAACSMFCRVYVDGALLANATAGGFTPFWVDVPPAAAAEREVVVVTSNVFSDDLTPTQHGNYDFYQYGGLLRSVALHTLPAQAPHIANVEVLPLARAAAPSGDVNVTVALSGGGVAAGSRVTLRLTWDGDAATAATAEHTVSAGGWWPAAVELAAVSVPSAKVWEPAAPALHTLTVAVVAGGAEVDSVTARFGLRVVSTSGRAIMINGKAVKLRGFNRHDMYPQLGPSLPVDLYKKDLDLLQGDTLNGNFIRGSHYPQDDRLLDLCDERGVFMWDEALAWGNSVGQLTDPRFMAAELATANAMVTSSINHPSVILWGFFNEGQSDNANATPSYAAMADAFRARDPTRLVTWASNRQQRDKGFQHADVISFNGYPGWYGGGWQQVTSNWLKQADWVAQNWPTKPFIISETGAGARLGHHTADTANCTRPPGPIDGDCWTEEYQQLVDGLNTGCAMNSSLIAGISLWQFSDIKVDQKNTSTGRPGGINNKGVLSRWREPKLSAAAVAAAYAHVTLPNTTAA